MKKFLYDETGATAIEYAMIASATATVLVAFMPAIAAALEPVFSTLATGLSGS